MTAYPNPFSTSTTISFFNTKPSKNTKIKIYNIKGHLVKQFKRQKVKGKNIEIVWKGKDENGKQLPNGIYLFKLTTKDYQSAVKKIILVK
ncbi:MAG: T9SS type A sorting domain-containing protein [Candidatus Cloacimonadota bacterium]|nr:T9SS type A sorting domain-containing protein [Candidatus Cloacimonadota bacterium]